MQTELSRRGFLFGVAATIAVIRTPGLIMPIKEIIEPWVRVPLGGTYNHVLYALSYKITHGYHPEDPDMDIRIQHMMEAGGIDSGWVEETEYRKVYFEHDDGYTGYMEQRLEKRDMAYIEPQPLLVPGNPDKGYGIPFKNKIAKAT